MPLRRGTPLVFKPATVSDAVDGTNAPPGAMMALTNLIPDPATDNIFVPRPAAIPRAGRFANIPSAGAISAHLVVGDIAYGMIASKSPITSGDFSTDFGSDADAMTGPANFDQPFAFNLATGAFLPLAGVTMANVPQSAPAPPAAWTPPFMAQVGSRIIVTHPGFPGGATKFGWFDVSAFSGSVQGTVTAGSNRITGNPAVAGLQPGLLISGQYIPAGTTIVSTAPFVLQTKCHSQDGLVIDGIPDNSIFPAAAVISGNGLRSGTQVVAQIGRHAIQITQGGTIVGQNVKITNVATGQSATGNVYTQSTLARVADLTGVAVGMVVAGTDIPVGATVTAVIRGDSGFNCVTLSQPIIGDGLNDDAITFSGSSITMSQNAAGTATATFAFAGGTAAAPLWGAGDCNVNPLPSIPVGVAEFFGRAYYALGTNGIVFSDAGFPCQVSNTGGVVQALTTNDGQAVTAIYPLMLSSPLVTTGVIQALVVFQGVAKMQQITGDAAFGTLNMAPLPVATGALSPLAIFACELGTGFISPEGLRFVDFNGTIGDPVGDAGAGVTVPFIFSAVPSRVAAAAGAHTLRVTTINGLLPSKPTPYQEYWYDIDRKQWSGPHSLAVGLIQPWRDTFVVTSGAIPELYVSDPVPSLASTYVENGQPLQFLFAPAPFPDTGAGAENALIDMTWAMQLPSVGSTQSNQAVWDKGLWDQAYWDQPPPLFITAFDIRGTQLDQTTINPTGPPASAWDRSTWDQSLWDLTGATFQQLDVEWHGPLVFKQLALKMTGQCVAGLRIGNGYMRYQVLGYRLQLP